MVMRGNRANDEEKKTIIDFMDGKWKRGDGGEKRIRRDVQTILVSEGNERIRSKAHQEPRLVYVETFFELHHETGKLNVRKVWKHIPGVSQSSAPSVPSVDLKK